MNKKLRRKLLQGMAIALPATWSTPVVKSIIIPAHAFTSFRNCDGVFCDLGFSSDVAGSASVINGLLTMIGIADTVPNGWSGSGIVLADGTFNIDITFENPNVDINGARGSVADDCSSISGEFLFNGQPLNTAITFSGNLSGGATSIDDCDLC